jgi:hypothetical protein
MCIDGSGGDNASASQTFYKRHINSRYEHILSKLPSYLSEITRTFTTVADQQYYHFPPNIKEIESLSVTVGSVTYPLTPVHSNKRWVDLNALTVQPSSIPQLYFKRQRDYGIWPIPQDAYSSSIEYSIRAGGLVRTDYVTGTVTATENDETVEGAGGTAWSTTTNVMPDDWFTLTDSNGETRGSWYRVASVTDADTLELESVFEETTEAGATYIIGQSPELPEDLHELTAHGALADYFAGLRQSVAKAQGWSNIYWTGDWGNDSRSPRSVSGGLIDGIRRYQNRSDSQLIERRKNLRPTDKVWGGTYTA